jgi:large subunit ribosomal protein L17
MRHLKRGRKLGRTHEHRKAMLGNLACSLFIHHRVETGHAKAMEVRRVVERLITFGKRGDLHARRLAARTIHDPVVLQKLFSEIAPKFMGRNGGYTRVLKKGFRPGDAAPVSIIELVGLYQAKEKVEETKVAEKKPAEKKPAAAKSETKEKKAAGA